jgi:methoxymalonate biosynthesis acyl carrier protein
MNTEESIRDSLREFIVSQRDLEDASVLADDTDLFAMGVLDSLMTVTLVAFCEERFECQMEVEELSPENFSSVNALTTFIAGKLNGSSRV